MSLCCLLLYRVTCVLTNKPAICKLVVKYLIYHILPIIKRANNLVGIQHLPKVQLICMVEVPALRTGFINVFLSKKC